MSAPDKSFDFSNADPASFGRAGQPKTGRPPVLIYSLLYLKLDVIAKLMAVDKLSDALIAVELGVSRVTIGRIRELLTDEPFYAAVGAAFEHKQSGKPDAGELWARVEDAVFGKIPGFRNTTFYRHMLATLAKGEVCDKMPPQKPANRPKRAAPVPGQGRGAAPTMPAPAAATAAPPADPAHSTKAKTAERDRLRRLHGGQLPGFPENITP